MNRRPFRQMAATFSVSTSALVRHHDEHVPEQLAKAQEAAEVAQADDLLGELVTLKARVGTILDKASKAEDWRSCAPLIRELRACIELLLEVGQKIDRRPTLNLLVAPEWLTVRATLLEALQPYPEARTAASSALLALEAPR